jgi:ribosome biogenesis GTPase / thiamine phosphate phosphatase
MSSSSDETYKRSTKSAYLKQRKKIRTREEQRLLAENSKRRKSGGGRGPRRNDWYSEDEDDSLDFERMRPAQQLDLERAKLEATKEREAEAVGTPDGVVVAVARDRVHVNLAGLTRTAFLEETSPTVAVGDEVFVEERADGELRLVGAGERRSVLSRPDPGNAHRERVLAANVDVAVIVASVAEPKFRPGLVDRFMIAVQRGGITPLLAVNKFDLLSSEDEVRELEAALAPFEQLGVEVLRVSAESGAGLDELRARLAGLTCVFVGHSGVGKSTILNACDTSRERDTGSGRDFDGKGRHTTTASELSILEDGTRLVDTPGIRVLGLWKVAPEELAECFPDFEEAIAACKFRDCSHLVEPQCGVKAAVERGEILESRYAVYARFHAELSE